MASHFKTFKLSEKTERLAISASMLDPVHMIQVQDENLIPFADPVVQILKSDIPQACETDTQMVGPSQDPVNLEVNLPRASASGDVSQQKPKSKYALLLNPIYNVNAKKQTKKLTINQKCINH